MDTLRDIKTLQKFVSAHASNYNHFNLEHHSHLRDTFTQIRFSAIAEWR
jgi:putative transposase